MSNTNSLINNIILNNQNIINKNSYNNTNIIINTTTINIENTPFTFNNNLKLLFCKSCFINLTNINYLEHLKKKHLETYKSFKKEDLEYIIQKLELANYEILENKLTYNKYYFKELIINYKGFKCLECLYINNNSKAI